MINQYDKERHMKQMALMELKKRQRGRSYRNVEGSA